MPRACIFGCPRPTRGILHTFPNQKRFPEQFKAWLDLVPENLRPPQNDFNNKRVCDRHFTDRDRNRNNRLNALAVPTLFLPDGVFSSPESKDVSTNETQSSLNILHTTASKADFDVPIEEVLASSCQMSTCVNKPQKINVDESDLSKADFVVPIEEVLAGSTCGSQMYDDDVNKPQKINVDESDDKKLSSCSFQKIKNKFTIGNQTINSKCAPLALIQAFHLSDYGSMELGTVFMRNNIYGQTKYIRAKDWLPIAQEILVWGPDILLGYTVVLLRILFVLHCNVM